MNLNYKKIALIFIAISASAGIYFVAQRYFYADDVKVKCFMIAGHCY